MAKTFFPEISKDAFHYIIVFSNRCRLTKVVLITNRHVIISPTQICATLLQNFCQEFFSDYELKKLYQKFLPLAQTSEQNQKIIISNPF